MPDWWSVDRLNLIRRTFDIMDADGMGSLDIQEVQPLFKYIIMTFTIGGDYAEKLGSHSETKADQFLSHNILCHNNFGIIEGPRPVASGASNTRVAA